MRVQRLIYYAKPLASHPHRCEWETARIVLFLRAATRSEGEALANSCLNERYWQPIRLLVHTDVEECRALAASEAIANAYHTARSGGVFFEEFPDTFGPRRKSETMVFSPAIDEAFVDRVIERAGGHRLSDEEADQQQSRNADYLLDNYVLELKHLQEEGLEKAERQEKIAAFFTADRWGDEVDLSAIQLSGMDLLKYLDIIGGPVKTQVRSASKQIRQTRQHLGSDNLRGGVIFLNTGYGSLPPALFERIVERYSKRYSSQIDIAICISVWVLTNGLEWKIYFRFHPLDPPDPAIRRIEDAFSACRDKYMRRWAQTGFVPDKNAICPVKPIAFDIAGRRFIRDHAQIPPSWRSES